MFQTFDTTSTPEHGPARLAALRTQLASQGLDGFLVPRADAHQGEYVAAHDERLQWFCGFTGSAGFCCALKDTAGVFIDGRYRTQVKSQVDLAHFSPVPWPDVTLPEWLKEQLPSGGIVGFDPWLLTQGQLISYETALAGTNIELQPTENLVDRIWKDQPAPPMSKAVDYPETLAGQSSASKRAQCGAQLHSAGDQAAVLTLPDSLAWLLNIRGNDVARNPIAHGFAILDQSGHVDLFMASEKISELSLGPDVTCHDPSHLIAFLGSLTGPIRVDKTSIPVAVVHALTEASVDVRFGDDPCALPKARKNPVEISGTREAHLTDGAAVCELLAWFDAQPIGNLTEIDVVTKLEQARRDTGMLKDISFETIAGAGPNGAIMHYRVSHDTNRPLADGDLLVLDSGGQYENGTTDITRTLPVGTPGDEERACFTRVLQGMIAVSKLQWPAGLAGRDIEAIGRVPLWQAGQDFNHGLGHGVGVYLSVHEGPQRLSKVSDVPLEAGMILSNEPGYYREGAFGIRIENLVVVQNAAKQISADPERDMLSFETITFAPIDKRLIDAALLSLSEVEWIDTYHRSVYEKLSDRVSPQTKQWLSGACAPLA